MHPTKHVLRFPLWGLLLLGLGLGAVAASVRAQEAPPPPRQVAFTAGRTLTVAVNATQPLQMPSKRPIKTVRNEKENVASVRATDEPTTVLITGLAPGITRVTLTDNKDTTEVYEVIVQTDVEFLSSLIKRAVPTATILPIPGTGNSIILTGSVAHAEDVDTIVRIAQVSVGGTGAQVVNAMRVGGVKLVQLDVVVASVNRSELRQMGFDFLSSGNQHLLTSSPLGSLTFPSQGISGSLAAPTIENTISGAANVFGAILTPRQQFYGFLQSLRDNNLGKILTEPKLVTLSGRPANLQSGGDVPILSAQALGTVNVEFRRVGTIMSFVPIVLGNGKIFLEVEMEVTDRNDGLGVTFGGNLIPGFDTRRVRDSVEIDVGLTLAIGGLVRKQVNASTRKVPILGDLPFIGAAFSRKTYNEAEEELIVLVTPHLVDAMDCRQVPPVLPGQETRSPDDFELFLEGILEAPRGPREVCPERRYVPAYQNDPTAGMFPCAGCGPFGGLGSAGSEAGAAPVAAPDIDASAPLAPAKAGPKAEVPAGRTAGADFTPARSANEPGAGLPAAAVPDRGPVTTLPPTLPGRTGFDGPR